MNKLKHKKKAMIAGFAVLSLLVFTQFKGSCIEPLRDKQTQVEAVSTAQLKIASASLETEKVSVEPELEVVNEPIYNEPIYSESDLYNLTALIYQEVGGESFETEEIKDEVQKLVGNVVLNRVSHKDYSNTIYDVLTAHRQYGFMWKYGIKIPETDNPIVLKALERCKGNAIDVLEGNRYCPENVVFQSEFKSLGDGIWKQFTTKSGKTIYFNYKK